MSNDSQKVSGSHSNSTFISVFKFDAVTSMKSASFALLMTHSKKVSTWSDISGNCVYIV